MFLEAFRRLKARITWAASKEGLRNDLKKGLKRSFSGTVLDSRDLSRLAHKYSKTGLRIKMAILGKTVRFARAGRGDHVRYLITANAGFRCQRPFGG